jgi:hypothetical protein
MKPSLFRLAIAACLLFVTLSTGSLAIAQDAPAGAPLDLPCATGVTVESLGATQPPDANGMALAGLRITIAPGGGFAAHTHPGTITVFVDSGSFGFTPLDDMEMTVNRAATPGTPAVAENVAPNTEVLLGAGDWLVESGMTHEAWNRGDDSAVVIVSGLVDPTLPFVQCVS